MSVKTTIRAIGLLALISAVFWSITGIGWWGEIPDSDFAKGVLLAVLHIAAVIGAAATFIPKYPEDIDSQQDVDVYDSKY